MQSRILDGMVVDRPRGRFRVHRAAPLAGLELHDGGDVVDDLPAHAHDGYDITLVIAGARRLAIGGGVHDVAAGEVFVTTAGDLHRGTSSQPWSFRSLYIPAAFVVDAVAETGSQGAPGFAMPRIRRPRFAATVAAACDAIATPASTLEQQSRLLAVLVDLVGDRLAHTGAERRATARVEDYIRAHLADDVSLDELADEAGLSRHYLLRAFRAERGVTPHGLQRRLRVAWARALLVAGRPAGEVATVVGFHDQSHLTRSFKRVAGVTPARFQRDVAG